MVLIDKHKARKAIHEHNPAGKLLRRETVLKLLGQLPEVDPVHAAGGAYCRECELRKDNIYGSFCGRYTQEARSVDPDGFCSYGRRKEGGE